MKISLIGIACVLAACAATATNMSSLRSPDLGRHNYRSILVVAAFTDVGLLRSTEDGFAATHLERVRFVSSYQIFFPGRQYTAEETRALLSRYDIDATLVIVPGQSGTTATYVPPTYLTGCTSWNPMYGCMQTMTTQIGGYAADPKPWARFTAQLYDARTGVSVWMASSFTGGNSWASFQALLRSLTDKTVAQLRQDSVVVVESDREACVRMPSSTDTTVVDEHLLTMPPALRTGYSYYHALDAHGTVRLSVVINTDGWPDSLSSIVLQSVSPQADAEARHRVFHEFFWPACVTDHRVRARVVESVVFGPSH